MIAPFTVRSVNHHGTLLFNESFFALLDVGDMLNLDIDNSYLTLDSGFDSEANKITITGQGLIPGNPSHLPLFPLSSLFFVIPSICGNPDLHFCL